MPEKNDVLKISKKKLRSILNDEEKTALAANLTYVSDTKPGIERKKEGKTFSYYFKGDLIKDDEELLRIRHLVLPPAWERVWICPKANGHLQATGYDTKGRKQYRYHSSWSTVRNHTKFYRMISFGKTLPAIRARLKKDLATHGLSVNKVLAAVISLMEYTNIRIGNSFYEKEYGSFGLTTLKDKHVKINGSSVDFSFKGKKGVHHEIKLKNRKLAKIIKQCRDIPGKELFQFYDADGAHHSIDSGMVNDYIRDISDASFTAKDFRTWSGTIHAFLELKEMGCCDTEAETKRNIVAALDKVSQHLGNTRTVCKKYYVHPVILTLYQDKKLEKIEIKTVNGKEGEDELFHPEERAVLKILESA